MTKIIAIHSYRGGTGKSNLTANLVTAMALQGKKIAVIDSDLQSPGIHNIFDLNENQITLTLNDYLWNRVDILKTVYDVSQKAGVANSSNIFLIPASTNHGEIARILSQGYNVNLLDQGIRELIKKLDLDYVFIDTHPGLNKEIFLSIAISNLLLLILRPDRQDYQGTLVLVDLAKQLKIGKKMMLLVNKVVNRIDFSDLKRQIENTYSIPVAGMFPLSEEMILLGSNGIFCQEYPDDNWTRSLFEVVNQIFNS